MKVSYLFNLTFSPNIYCFCHYLSKVTNKLKENFIIRFFLNLGLKDIQNKIRKKNLLKENQLTLNPFLFFKVTQITFTHLEIQSASIHKSEKYEAKNIFYLRNL